MNADKLTLQLELSVLCLASKPKTHQKLNREEVRDYLSAVAGFTVFTSFSNEIWRERLAVGHFGLEDIPQWISLSFDLIKDIKSTSPIQMSILDSIRLFEV